MASGEEFVKQLSNFVNSLIAIAPSRNYVTQFLYIIKMNGSIDYRVLEEAYPDIMKDEYTREAFAKIFGISFSDKVSLESGKYGWWLTDFINAIFQLFEDANFRSQVSMLLKDEYPEGVPNLVEEWLKVRIEGLVSEPTYGKTAIKILKELVKFSRLKPEEIEKKLEISRGVALESLNLLSLYNLVIKEYDGSYKPEETLRKYSHVLEGIDPD